MKRPLLIVIGILISIICGFAQTSGSLEGIILDVEGEPLPGTAVTIKDRGVGTLSDGNGHYRIDGLAEGDVLEFDLLGFLPQSVKYSGKKVLNIVMQYASQSLDDIVVVGYGTQKKVSITGALSQIKPEVLISKPAPTITSLLGGSLPGIITRQSSSEPGKDQTTVLIRGLATWRNGAPLILVDGVERDLNLVNSNEVESFTILKDASATAVYGVRGANGVILINTKKGTMGKPKVVFRSEAAVLQGLRFPQYINAYEFASLMNEAVAHNTGGTGTPAWTEQELLKFRDHTDPYLYPDVNWIEEVLNKTAFQAIDNITVSGGNEIVRYYINLGYSSQTGLFKEDPEYKYDTNTRSDRYNFRATTDVNITKNLLLNLSLGAIFQDKTFPGIPSDEIFRAMRQNSPISMPVRNPDGTPGSGASGIILNPWALSTQSGYTKWFQSTIQSTANISWDMSKLITPGLSIASKLSFDTYMTNEAVRTISYGMKRYLGTDIDGVDQYNTIREQGTMGYSHLDGSNRTYYIDLSLNYARSFGRHDVSGMILLNRRDYKDLTASSTLFNLPYRHQGIAGRFTYAYGGRYFGEFNFGYNGSENFPKGQRYGFFPSASIGWNITGESFIPESVKKIASLKLRASYGLAGNDQIQGDRFLYISTVNYSWGARFGLNQQDFPGIFEEKIGADVTWEKSYKSNFGFDLKLFGDLLSLQADWFNEDRKDILLSRGTIPIVTGIRAATWANLGEVHNSGVDAMLELKKQTTSGFYYSFYGNFTYAHNIIVEDDSPIPEWSYQNSRGHSIGQPYGYIAIGLFEDEADIASSPKQELTSVVRPGDIKYKDVNKDGVVDADDRTYFGYPRMPEIMYGFGMTLAYKGFDFTLGFTGAARTNMFLTSEDMWPYSLEYPRYNISREYYDHRWIEGADNTNALYPAVINGNSPNNYVKSTLYMRDASYLKLKNAEIGYTLPGRVCEFLGIEKVRVFANGINLLCFDKIKITDPEMDSGTGDYPQQRTINLGVQVNF